MLPLAKTDIGWLSKQGTGRPLAARHAVVWVTGSRLRRQDGILQRSHHVRRSNGVEPAGGSGGGGKR